MDRILCTMSFTGYRPNRLGGFAGERAMIIQSGVKKKMIEVILRAHAKGYSRFVSGGALGIDQIAAEAILEVRDRGYLVELVMALPFPSQDRKWPPYAQEKYRRLLSRADEIIYCSEDPYAVWKMQKRNVWMVDNSSVVVAFWAGDAGGTKNCVEYARSKQKSTLIINPYTLEERWERP